MVWEYFLLKQHAVVAGQGFQCLPFGRAPVWVRPGRKALLSSPLGSSRVLLWAAPFSGSQLIERVGRI